MVKLSQKNYLKNGLASGMFSMLSMRYGGCTSLQSLSRRSLSELHFPCVGSPRMCWGRPELCPLTGEPDSACRSRCRNPFCHPRVTLCSVLPGSAIPFPGSEEKSVRISALRGDPGWDCEFSAAEPGFVAAPVQLVLNHNTVNHNSAFEIRHHGVMFARCWNTERQQDSW